MSIITYVLCIYMHKHNMVDILFALSESLDTPHTHTHTHTHTTVLRPFFRDHPGEPVP